MELMGRRREPCPDSAWSSDLVAEKTLLHGGFCADAGEKSLQPPRAVSHNLIVNSLDVPRRDQQRPVRHPHEQQIRDEAATTAPFVADTGSALRPVWDWPEVALREWIRGTKACHLSIVTGGVPYFSPLDRLAQWTA